MKLGRRNFLKLAGAAAAGAAATACSAAPPAQAPSSAPGTSLPPSTSATPPSGPPDWAALREKVSLLLPGDSGYDNAKRVFNPAFDDLKPAAIAKCAKPEDVQAAVEAAARRVPIAARGGGHSYAGYSVPDGGLMIDLGGMSSVDVQGDRVVIGAGAKLKDVYAILGGAGRCLPAGSCPSVGIAGLTLGGGIGVLARKYGLTCDHLVSAQVVTADGVLRTASADSEPELFWALRGGGGGNFGVVTSFTFRTDPSPSVVSVFSLNFPAGSANDVLAEWQRWLPEAPPELWANVVLSGGSPVGARVSGCHVGDSASLGRELDKLTGKVRGTRTVKQLDYLGAMKYFSGSESRQSFVASSRILGEVTDPAKLTSILDGRRGMDLLVDGLGGAVADIAPDATAFWHRKAIGSVQIYSRADTRNRSVATDSVAEVVTGLGLGGGYVNYIDPALPDWMTAYYGDNAARLKKVAKTYDPEKVFGFAQAVTPA
ncbi:FAD-binding dehydrogenase [Amycolatopsis coloradensis]|uniref:FAD-binding dehydrogenase n=1 Tax=Amycolatopsis coloradensis TaxID=76021 RepID=A0A1R0KPF1_9PSEU|nr:FAD-binding oxidoreductase [Amycolatopsis coloradensis]OLZ49060.1 FAD-binding dehydrogenase [Amycolatopsis coloradensis]